jgi:response regulator RpfG family c-di-GMP phosphodiesterase
MARILVVDDEESVRKLLKLMLERDGHECETAAHAEEALEHLKNARFDLVLSDVMMPGKSGIELARNIRTMYPETGVILITGVDDFVVAKEALGAGIYDYITKPVEFNRLVISVANALRRRELELESRAHSEQLERLVRMRTDELYRSLKKLRATLEGTIRAMAATVEMRDPYTAGHQARVAQLASAVGAELGLRDHEVKGVHLAGMIHDLGKIAVPSEILNKPGRITDAEFLLIKSHPRVAYDILRHVKFPWPIADMVVQHHERLDGSGYPDRLSGEEILMGARILGVADVVEAMASHRPYRPALGLEKALEEISSKRGVLYDPDVVDACIKVVSSTDGKVLSLKEGDGGWSNSVGKVPTVTSRPLQGS